MSDLAASVSPAAASRKGALAAVTTGPAFGGVSLAVSAPLARFILRGEAAADPAAAGLGGPLPRTVNRAATAGARSALCIGPDEWLLLAPEADKAAFEAALHAALAGVPHALVDVSHRQTAILLDGPGAALALNAAVPLDLGLAAFHVGMATRTIFEKAEIVLWRTGPESFHLEVWRSFAPYVWDLLEAVRTENAAA
jgi:sarcosine oxidase subunit gamma